MTEMAENAGRIAAAVSIPVIADSDIGYVNELNATRTVREYEQRGAIPNAKASLSQSLQSPACMRPSAAADG